MQVYTPTPQIIAELQFKLAEAHREISRLQGIIVSKDQQIENWKEVAKFLSRYGF